MGAHYDGAWAEFALVPWYALAALPDQVSLEHGAIACDAVSTPYAALLERGALRPGERVGLWGIGGLGTHAVQIARLAGAAFIAAVDPISEAHGRARARPRRGPHRPGCGHSPGHGGVHPGRPGGGGRAVVRSRRGRPRRVPVVPRPVHPRPPGLLEAPSGTGHRAHGVRTPRRAGLDLGPSPLGPRERGDRPPALEGWLAGPAAGHATGGARPRGRPGSGRRSSCRYVTREGWAERGSPFRRARERALTWTTSTASSRAPPSGAYPSPSSTPAARIAPASRGPPAARSDGSRC